MNAEEFAILADLAKREAGLVFAEDKRYLVESRILTLVRERCIASLADLVMALRRGDREMIAAVVDGLTNNETSFFRDQAPFALFRDQVLPALARGGERTVRVWSAACSTGQEPYSLAMQMDRSRSHFPGLKLDILGTDISDSCLEVAREGLYSPFEVPRGIDDGELNRYFTAEGKGWRIRPFLREAVRWRRFNLLQPAAELGRFEVVFCRNVLIYFDQPTRRKVLEQMAAAMPEDGYLFLGASETVLGVSEAFTPMPGAPGVYRPNPAMASRGASPMRAAMSGG